MRSFGKRYGKLTVVGALAAVFAVAGMTVSLSNFSTAAAEEESVPKLLYYVDAGNLVVNQDGTGQQADRGVVGYSSKIANGFMEKYGLSFGTSDGAGLYNSVTDKVYGVDDVTGKFWGFNDYTSWNEWRYGLTASKEAGYDSYRQIGEQGDEGILTYTFEVDDDTTELSLTFGTRTAAGWGEKPSQYRINGGDAIDYTAQESDEQISVTTKGVEKDGAYFVTLEFGLDGENAFVNWIMISTSDYTLPEAQTTYTFSKFAVKGETTVKAVSSDGDTVDATLDAENAQKIATADNFTSVTVKATIAEKLHENIPVTVLPKGTKMFVDIGGSGDGIHLLKDVAYNEELGYGYVSGYGTPAWVDDAYDSSICYGANNNTLEYRFDGLTEGDYGVIVGADAKNWGDRTMYVSVNGSEDEELSVLNNNTASGTYYGQVADDGVLTVAVKKGSDNYIVSYMLVYSVNKLTFESCGGNEIDAVYFEEGTSVNISSIVPQRAGYSFNGWFTAETEGEKVEGSVVETQTLYAHWMAKDYTVYLTDMNDESDCGTLTLRTDEEVEGLPTDLTHAGYTFQGWYTAEVGGKKVENGDLWVYEVDELLALFTPNEYTVTLNYGAGSAPAEDGNSETALSVTAIYDKKISLPVAIPEEGYEFIGWYTAETEGTKVEDGSVWKTEESITLYARYEKKAESYTVTFNTLGGSTVEPVTVDADEKIQKPTDPEREGYTFSGWFTDEACTEEFNFTESVIDADTMLYAGWSKVEPEPEDPSNGNNPDDPDPNDPSNGNNPDDPDPNDPSNGNDPDPDESKSGKKKGCASLVSPSFVLSAGILIVVGMLIRKKRNKI